MVAKAISDEELARRMQTIDTLVNVFGFDYAVAEQAYDAVSSSDTNDISAYYNYILDQGLATDAGGPVIPIDDCPHLPPTDLNTSTTISKSLFSSPCSGAFVDLDTKPSACPKVVDPAKDGLSCGLTTENWLCLSCGKLFCSRYQASHCYQHYQHETKHAVHVSTVDLSVWCHSCQAYLSTNTGATGRVLQGFMSDLEKLKHGN